MDHKYGFWIFLKPTITALSLSLSIPHFNFSGILEPSTVIRGVECREMLMHGVGVRPQQTVRTSSSCIGEAPTLFCTIDLIQMI